MTYRTASITEHAIWRSRLVDERNSLANAMREAIASTRSHLLDFIRLNEPAPWQAQTLAEWSRPTTLQSLIATYSDHIYRHQMAQPRENKPLLSLWAQWYLGLMVPPLLLALLTQKSAISLAPEHFHVEFHETGRAACFWIDVQQDHQLTLQNDAQRITALASQAMLPVVQALEATGDINGKLIWSNTGYLINWCLGEMIPQLGEARVAALRQTCFFEKQLSDGSDNPLWRTVVLRDGALVRRTCCQRYRLPDVQQCGDCTLK
ncbi:siderophore-iron reductase FhuF [Kosakonia radicincitans]|uniref:siderophore-iron reductase FhuF n=1 Tax=Kosakonia radicincitans TaxID=283686 RepID=UPI0011EF820B|nr:siderophore-iron reductase FhuF [Kosakonia radicincitans]MDD7994789.1 siderophore-iron reductase FhuF [Kosakonia radicincitans]QEM93286.1 siderophore-iron reductase FhuF [Kosakonia radicincitans]